MADEYFTPPGLVRVSPSALALARTYGEEVRQERPDENRIVVFVWAYSRRLREKGTNNWSELGPGLGLHSEERRKVPEKGIHVADELEFAVKIPRAVLDASSEKLIDTDDSMTLFRLILR